VFRTSSRCSCAANAIPSASDRSPRPPPCSARWWPSSWCGTTPVRRPLWRIRSGRAAEALDRTSRAASASTATSLRSRSFGLSRPQACSGLRWRDQHAGTVQHLAGASRFGKTREQGFLFGQAHVFVLASAIRLGFEGLDGEHIYLNLADEHWRTVDIGPDGWRVIGSPPVHFCGAPECCTFRSEAAPLGRLVRSQGVPPGSDYLRLCRTTALLGVVEEPTPSIPRAAAYDRPARRFVDHLALL
jgi:hypothetical protein